jgi:catalase
MRVVSHLLLVDEGLAKKVAEGLRLKDLPPPATAARKPITDLPPSKKLSIVANGPQNLKGRKVGALVTDGVDANLLKALREATTKAGAKFELIAPMVGGVEASDGSWIEADEKLDGGPSVLYDAVALLPSKDGIEMLAGEPTARDFVADAFAHMKFIAYVDEAIPLFEKAGVSDVVDDGCFNLKKTADAGNFIKACGKLRFWDREPQIKKI